MDTFNISAGPLQGLERISQELQQERAKCTAALKDRARQKIEIEKLKQKNNAYQEELVELRERLEEAEQQLQNDNNELNQSSFKINDKEKEISLCQSELQAALSSLSKTKNELLSMQASYAELREQYASARSEWEDESEGRDLLARQVQELQESNRVLREMQSSGEDAVAAMRARYAEQLRELEELRIRSRKYDTVAEKYSSLLQSSDEIRRELEDTLRRNTSLSHQCREAQGLAQTREEELRRSEEQLDEADAQIKALQEENRDILDVQRELSLQIEAHKSSLEAERQRSEDGRVNRQYLDAHINELRDAHAAALQQVAAAEADLAAANTKVSALSTEVSQLREQAQLVEVAQREAECAHNLSVEVETLRGELTNVRRQLVRREVEDEANAAIGESSLGGIGSKAMSEREANSRKVYEGIIEDLRSSLDKAINEQYSLTSQLELARRKAVRVEQLEEEISMYRDTVKLVAVENQSAVVSISESMERMQKLEHENQGLVRSVRALENDARLNQADLKRLREELQEEKKRHRGVHVDKLGVERKLAELNSERSRLETIEVDLRREVEQKEYDNKRSERQVADLREELRGVREALAAREADGDQSGRRAQEQAQQLSALRQRLSDAEGEVRALRETRATLQREIDMLNEVTSTHRRSAAEASLQMDDMRREIEELKSASDVNRKTVSQRGNENAEQQIQMLRGDLLKTVSDWKEAERERQLKEDASRRLQAELMKERDRSQLLQSQVAKLEERLLAANRELAAFRGLDVYHAAKEAELAAFRSSRGLGAAAQQSTLRPLSPKRAAAMPLDSRAASFAASGRPLSLPERAPTPRSSSIGEPLNIDDISSSASPAVHPQDGSPRSLGKGSESSRRSSYLDDDTDDDADQRPPAPQAWPSGRRTSDALGGGGLRRAQQGGSGSDEEEARDREPRPRELRSAGLRTPSQAEVPLSEEEPPPLRAARRAPAAAVERGEAAAPPSFTESRLYENRFVSSAPMAASAVPYSSSSSSSSTQAAASARPVERVRPHRDMTYNPSKADFEKARQLLARSGRNKKF